MNRTAAVEFFVFLVFSLIALAGMVWLFSGATGRAIESFCIDTDSGLNFTVKGVVYSLDRPYADTCYNAKGAEAPSGEGLWEYYCKDSRMKKLHYRCPHNCIGGVCLVR